MRICFAVDDGPEAEAAFDCKFVQQKNVLETKRSAKLARVIVRLKSKSSQDVVRLPWPFHRFCSFETIDVDLGLNLPFRLL